MSYENAKANLKELGKDLKISEELQFDENHTCILGIDNAFSLHITYEPHSDRLYLYSPVLDGLPKQDSLKLKLYEALLSGSMLGAQMAGGGVGVATKEELVLMHSVIEMGIAADGFLLSRFAPVFVETVEKWRRKAKDISEGREPVEEDMPPAQNPMNVGAPKQGPSLSPQQPFIKI
ncbi:CesT family type III secretion system chaperone [Rhabdochlamydiaceae symbiont of Dictyostelium giganteum]|uniref:CesT family type III secretion system chaperone n=1 Tax=Rhabdochlamydiaceae symbiont of Dictyostelium giganteum TaxID=3342349 RepID=UPI00384ABC1C